MTDRLDAHINAFVVELLDQPVEPPPFPGDVLLTTERRRPLTRRSGWALAAAVFAVVILAGVVSVILFSSQEAPVVEPTPESTVETLAGAINRGDLDATMALFAEDAQCVAPGLPTCADLFGFFIAAKAQLVFSGCEVEVEPYLQCRGYLHTSIHDALGISIPDLETNPNFPPALIVESGHITQFNFHSPFTGLQDLDAALWTHLTDIGATYVNNDGVPRFSAAIVPDLIEDAQVFSEQQAG